MVKIITNELLTITKILSVPNHQFKLVGGIVRDYILNQAPSKKDYDIASNFTAEQNIKLLTKHGIKVIPKSIKYGTITAIYNKYIFEITSLRQDITTYGRQADISSTNSFFEDASRRDFTFNAIYLDLITKEITDYFDGVNHLKAGKVIFIGDAEKRIQEDYLRILRFFRFYNIYGKENINTELIEILKENSQNLKLLSKERISSELFQILRSDNPFKVLKLLLENKILDSLIQINPMALNNLNNIEEIENIFHIKDYRLRIAFIIANQSDISEICILKKDILFIKNIMSLSNFIRKNNVFEFVEICDLLSNYNYDEVIIAILLSAIYDNNNKYHYLKIVTNIKNKLVLKIPVNANDLKKIGFKSDKTMGIALKEVTKLFYLYGKEDKQFYLDKISYLLAKYK